MTFRKLGLACTCAAMAAATMLASDSAGAQTPERRNLISVNPLGIPFEYVSGEYERFSSKLTSIGLQLGYLGFDNESYSTVEGKLRFYLNEEGPRGLSLGLAGGFSRITQDQYNSSNQLTENVSETRPTIAVIVDYNWILGKAQRVVVGTGVGAKRILGSGGEFDDPLRAYPTARFQIGVRY